MRRSVLALSLFLAVFIAFAQPGLCPCWLMIDVAAHHPHLDGHPERPHTHGYLFDLFQAQTVAAVPLTLVPLSILIALQAAGGLWQPLHNLSLHVSGWSFSPPTPPPRM